MKDKSGICLGVVLGVIICILLIGATIAGIAAYGTYNNMAKEGTDKCRNMGFDKYSVMSDKCYTEYSKSTSTKFYSEIKVKE